MLGVKPVRRDDINDVDVRVIGHFLHRVIVIDAPVGKVVLGLPFFGLGRRAGDDAGETAIFCLLQRGGNLVGAQAAEADQGDAELFVRVGGEGSGSQGAGKRRGGYNGPGLLDIIAVGK